jgi:anti-sigma regulatory factor (Ser/Thr protein kinase)
VAHKLQGHQTASAPAAAEPAPVAGALPRRSFLELGPLPTAVACARLHAKNVLLEWGLATLVDDVELIISELMTNALDASAALPSAPPIGLALLNCGDRLVIEAWDHSPDDPVRCEASDEDECGRGLVVIEALSDRWGVNRTGYATKAVWCELVVTTD